MNKSGQFPDDALLARLFEGELTESENDRLQEVLSQNPDLRDEVRQIRRMADVIPREPQSEPTRLDDADVRAAWNRVAERTGIQRSGGRTGLRLIRSVPARWAVAASVLALVAVGWLLSNGPNGTEWQEVTANRGQTASLTLADGSSVILNAESHIRYDVGPAADVRRINLEGEARFDVASDGRPFLVETPHATVRVLGTRFTVRVRDATTRVAVQEGRVAVDVDSVHVELSEKQAVEVSLKGVPVRLGSGYADVADDWTEGTMSFTTTGIREVLDEVGRRYDVDIELEGTWTGEETLTGSFPGADARTTLETICRTFDCTVVAVDNRYILRKARLR